MSGKVSSILCRFYNISTAEGVQICLKIQQIKIFALAAKQFCTPAKLAPQQKKKFSVFFCTTAVNGGGIRWGATVCSSAPILNEDRNFTNDCLNDVHEIESKALAGDRGVIWLYMMLSTYMWLGFPGAVIFSKQEIWHEYRRCCWTW